MRLNINKNKILTSSRTGAILKASLTLSVLTLVTFSFTACEQKFQGQSTQTTKKPIDENTISPEETDASGDKGVPVTEVCTGSHKAVRLYFVVDNSNSHGYVIPGQAEREGTDPVRTALSVRAQNEAKTFRQEALYTIVKRTVELDAQAKSTNPDFLGTDFGISYFPKYRGDGNPSTRYDGELADLSEYVAVTGPQGTGAAVFPQVLTNLSEVTLDQGFQDSLWSSFDFTHTAGGSTPYATGLKGAVEQFTSAARPEGDSRESIIIFLTDGLPTDEKPSQIEELRSQIGTDTKLITVAVYDPNEDPKLKDSPLYKNLKGAFLGPVNWATKPGSIYSKNESGFDQYWNDLIAIPGKISNEIVNVPQASDLQKEIDRILEVAQTCTKEPVQ